MECFCCNAIIEVQGSEFCNECTIAGCDEFDEQC